MQFKQFQISLGKLQLAPGLRDLYHSKKRITGMYVNFVHTGQFL